MGPNGFIMICRWFKDRQKTTYPKGFRNKKEKRNQVYYELGIIQGIKDINYYRKQYK